MTALRSAVFWALCALATLLAGAAIVLVVAVTFPFDRRRVLAHPIARLWARALLAVNPAWRLSVTGAEHIGRGPYAIVCNHESNLDPLLVAALPLAFKAIGKRSVFFVPFLGWAALALGFIPLRRGDRDSIAACMIAAERWVRRGASVLFFPEGTRSRDGTLGPFKRGAFDLALRTRVPVLPLTLAGTRGALPKGSWKFAGHARLRLHVDPPLPPPDLPPDRWQDYAASVRSLIAARRAAIQAER